MEHSVILRSIKFFLATALVAIVLSGCGDDGAPGAPGADGPIRTSVAESLDITIDKVTINSAPMVEFTVKDESGIPLTGLTVGRGGNLRFNIAKLVPGSFGGPSAWQNYINNVKSGAKGTFLQGTYERDGTLEDLSNGQFIYTFQTDINDTVATEGISYDPSLTHRVAIQVDGFPATNPTYDFRPDGGVVTVMRDIVKTESCNSCHNKLAIHGGGRIETKYCVTCHNPGSTDPDTGNTVGFKVMIHKIHRGEDLPSVKFGPDLIDDGGAGDDGTGEYQIIGYNSSVHDYSTVVFPQDIRNCSKCHDGGDPDTPQGDNWKTQLSMEACGSCHDDKDFSRDGTVWGADDPLGHSGGIMSDNSLCSVCHKTGGIASSVEESHTIQGKAESENYQFNIVDVSGSTTPVIQISVTDPTASDTPYDLSADEFTGGGARLAVIIGWGTIDFNNTGGTTNSGYPNFRATAALPISIDPVAACGAGITDWVCTPDTPTAGIYTLEKQSLLPASATGTGRVGFEGHVAADFDGDLSYDDQLAIKSVVKDFVITGTLTPRREVVDIAKCNNCHEQLSLHGGNRNDEPALCVICHNPNATDIGRRPVLVTDTTDGKVEGAIDFKTLIHGIHAAAETNYDTSEGHGFREQGLVVWGYPGAPCDQFGGPVGSCEHDFSHVRYPGILSDCTACHKSGTYELGGDWVSPTTNGRLSTTITTSPANTDPVDDLNITPTAAVCSACHDSELAKAHMQIPGGAVFDETQSIISTTPVIETCSVCHGPGRDADVEVVHGFN